MGKWMLVRIILNSIDLPITYLKMNLALGNSFTFISTWEVNVHEFKTRKSGAGILGEKPEG